MLTQDKALNDLVRSIKDRDLKRQLKDIVTQRLLYKVYCNSKKCKGTLIFNIYLRNGHQIPEEQVSITQYEVRARKRFDNEWGFKCGKCGNDSIMCQEEKGILPTGPSPNHPSLTPTPDHIKQIQENLANRTAPYQEKNGKKEVDGFVLERMTDGI